MVDRRELRRGLRATWPYLLSHHLPSEYDRCYRLSVWGRSIHLCARCFGIYVGLSVGLGGLWIGLLSALGVSWIALAPLPALVDWTVTAVTDRRGLNSVRTASGALLGYAYAHGLWRLLGGDLSVTVVGAMYAVVAGGLLYAVGDGP